MKYIDFAENERLSTIVLGMMRISELSEDEVEALVEAALSIGINTFDSLSESLRFKTDNTPIDCI